MSKVVTIELDVVGLTFHTKRSARQALADRIEREGPIEGMRFEREPTNPKDANAIKVLLPLDLLSGLWIGHLRASAVERLAPKVDAGQVEFVDAALVALNEVNDYGDGTLEVTLRDNRPAAKQGAKPDR